MTFPDDILREVEHWQAKGMPCELIARRTQLSLAEIHSTGGPCHCVHLRVLSGPRHFTEVMITAEQCPGLVLSLDLDEFGAQAGA